MADVKCPAGMVLINSGGPVHPDEPAFCVDRTEVTQAADKRFWVERQRAASAYELVIKWTNGATTSQTNVQEWYLRQAAAMYMQQNNVAGVAVVPFVQDIPQPVGPMLGPQKPAVLRTWYEARSFCQGRYQGGDLPTNRQWEKACGGGVYCTATGNLSRSEAVYRADAPADVGSTLPNANGVYDMTGNVWEWARDEANFGYGVKGARGGSWSVSYFPWLLKAWEILWLSPDQSNSLIGFRCVASPLPSEKETAQPY